MIQIDKQLNQLHNDQIKAYEKQCLKWGSSSVCVLACVCVCVHVSEYGQLLTRTVAHQANEKVDTCSPVNF